MQHYRHPGLAGRLPAGADALVPHPDASAPEAEVVWVPIAGEDHVARGAAAGDVPLEGVTCVPTRAGCVRVAAVPHVAQHLALGDELAVAALGDMTLARGELANALAGTVRIMAAPDSGLTWRDLARLVAAAADDDPWLDVISNRALAVSVPRSALSATFDALRARAEAGELEWEYATPQRH